MERRRWTMVGDDVIHSRETSPGSADPVSLVLLHGVGNTSRYFRPLLAALDGHVYAAAVELPGIGSSRGSRVPVDVAGQAEVVVRWMRATRTHPAVLVGNSMGSQTAVEVAVRAPDLVAALVLISPTVDTEARDPLRQVGRLVLDAFVERPSLLALTLTDSFLTSRRAVLRYFRAALQHPIEERIGLVRAPILVLRGALDPVVPRRWARHVAARARQGEYIEVRGAAHACHHGRPEAVARLLVERYG